MTAHQSRTPKGFWTGELTPALSLVSTPTTEGRTSGWVAGAGLLRFALMRVLYPFVCNDKRVTRRALWASFLTWPSQGPRAGGSVRLL
jgi:hypothetical protein